MIASGWLTSLLEKPASLLINEFGVPALFTEAARFQSVTFPTPSRYLFCDRPDGATVSALGKAAAQTDVRHRYPR
jgi:hypothetical protein